VQLLLSSSSSSSHSHVVVVVDAVVVVVDSAGGMLYYFRRQGTHHQNQTRQSPWSIPQNLQNSTAGTISRSLSTEHAATKNTNSKPNQLLNWRSVFLLSSAFDLIWCCLVSLFVRLFVSDFYPKREMKENNGGRMEQDAIQCGLL